MGVGEEGKRLKDQSCKEKEGAWHSWVPCKIPALTKFQLPLAGWWDNRGLIWSGLNFSHFLIERVV
jgi:hypothetical protein